MFRINFLYPPSASDYLRTTYVPTYIHTYAECLTKLTASLT